MPIWTPSPGGGSAGNLAGRIFDAAALGASFSPAGRAFGLGRLLVGAGLSVGIGFLLGELGNQLGNLWNALNGRGFQGAGAFGNQDINVAPGSTVAISWRLTNVQSDAKWCDTNNFFFGGGTDVQVSGFQASGVGIIKLRPGSGTRSVQCGTPGNNTPATEFAGAYLETAGGSPLNSFQTGLNSIVRGTWYQTTQVTFEITNVTVNGAVLVPQAPPRDDPAPLPPVPELEPATEPQRPPIPLPPVVPVLVPFGVPGPAGAPGAPGAPGTSPTPRAPGISAPPGSSPLPIPSPVPVASPPLLGNPTNPNGTPQAPPVPNPVPTPIGQEETPLGPVGGGGSPPAPTPEGMAQELGRIEQKLLKLMEPASLIQDIWDAIKTADDILDLLSLPYGPGEYQLAPVCDRDEEGNLLEPFVSSWPGGIGNTGEITSRIDALAELLQAHKNFKQPICRRGPPQGEEVTVNFWEVI